METIPELAAFGDGEPDIPFALSWANEPWTKRWAGGSANSTWNDTVLLPQDYGNKADWDDHARLVFRRRKTQSTRVYRSAAPPRPTWRPRRRRDLRLRLARAAPPPRPVSAERPRGGAATRAERVRRYLVRFFRHKNYIRVAGNKPLFLVYRLGHPPLAKARGFLETLQAVARDAGFKNGVHVVSTVGNFYGDDRTERAADLADATMHFWPQLCAFTKACDHRGRAARGRLGAAGGSRFAAPPRSVLRRRRRPASPP